MIPRPSPQVALVVVVVAGLITLGVLVILGFRSLNLADIRNQLAVMHGQRLQFLELMEQDKADRERMIGRLDRIERAVTGPRP